MKVMKYIAVLAIALFAFANASNAQNVAFLGGGPQPCSSNWARLRST